MFKKLWQSIDGYKTVSGLAITSIGGVMFLFPLTAPYASKMVITGVTTTVGGLIDKGRKKIKSIKQNRKENKQ